MTDGASFTSDELPEGFGPGPYGYLVMPPGLDESEWTIEDDPITEKDRADGYRCAALYAASPNAGYVSREEFDAADRAYAVAFNEQMNHLHGTMSSADAIACASKEGLRAALSSLGLGVK